MSHTFIYLDESGCLGFKSPDSTQYFVITFLKIEGEDVHRKVMKAVKRTIRNKTISKNKKSIYELKGSKTSSSTKGYFIKQMPHEGWKIYSVILNKKRVAPHLQNKEGKQKLYNYLVNFLLGNVKLATNISQLDLYLDKCKTTKEQKDFNTYITNQMNLPSNVPFNIDHVLSHQHPAIQAVDLFCWGIAGQYEEETGTERYLKIREWYLKFQDYIIFEEVYLPDKKQKSAIPLKLMP